MEEYAGAAVKHTGYNLRMTAERARRWAALSSPGERTATVQERVQRGVSQRTHSRVSQASSGQRRIRNCQARISRAAHPMQRSNEQQNSLQIPDGVSVGTQTSPRGASVSSVHDVEVSETHSQVTGVNAFVSHNRNTVSSRRQGRNGTRDVPYTHDRVASASRRHVSDGNDTQSQGSELSVLATLEREVDSPARNRGEMNITMRRREVSGRRQSNRHEWFWTLADQTQLGQWAPLFQHRNLVMASVTVNLSEVVINEEHVHSSLKCVVCLLYFELNDIVHKLPCDHIYHKNCIIPWLEHHTTCPMCRRSVQGSYLSSFTKP